MPPYCDTRLQDVEGSTIFFSQIVLSQKYTCEDGHCLLNTTHPHRAEGP